MVKLLKCWGYDDTHGAAYEAIIGFVAFVAGADNTQAYSAFVASNDNTETFDFRDPLVYQAPIKKDLDLPRYMEAMTGDDHGGFYEAMRKEVSELKRTKLLDTNTMV